MLADLRERERRMRLKEYYIKDENTQNEKSQTSEPIVTKVHKQEDASNRNKIWMPETKAGSNIRLLHRISEWRYTKYN